MGFRFDPRTKFYFLLLANLLLFFHVSLYTEMMITALFLFPFFPAGKVKMGLRLGGVYLTMILVDFFVIPVAEGFWLNLLSLFSVGIRMMLPCVIAGAYAFSTTTMGEFVCAMRKMRLPEGVIITCSVVIRFFPTIAEDYRQIKSAMTLRGMSSGWKDMIFRPFRSLEYILIPLLLNSSTVAQDLSIAALTKGIGMPGRHTSIAEIRMSGWDWSAVCIYSLPVLAGIGGWL